MAKFIGFRKERSVVIRKAYDTAYSDWICEYEHVATIETDEGMLVDYPALLENNSTTLDYTADECVKEMLDDNVRIIMPYDCPVRDNLIKENITEWVCNEGCVAGSLLVEAVCSVVSLLTRNGMWKNEYAKCIDIDKIKDEWNEE